MTDAPPPYPGINGYHGYANGAASAGAGLYRSLKLKENKYIDNNVVL